MPVDIEVIDTSKRKLINALRKTLKYIQLGWTRGQLARDKKGNPVPVHGRRVARVCLLGAVKKASLNIYIATKVCQLLTKELPQSTTWRSLALFNDHQKSKAPVIKLIERAIERAKRW
jgi:hypothetical protein